jgi:fucose permease
MLRGDMKAATPSRQDENVSGSAPAFQRDRLTWAAYWLLGYFAFLEAVLGPLMPFIRGDLHLSYAVASLHFSVFALGGIIMGILSDRLARWHSQRTALWGGAAGMALGAGLLAIAPRAALTILAAFIMGLLGVLLLNTLQAVLSEHHGPRGTVALTEANVMASLFAILAAALVGGLTATGLAWRWALVPPIILLALLALSYRSVPFGQASHARQMRHGERHARALPLRYWALWVVVALETGAEWSVAYWGSSFLVRYGGLAKAGAATALSAFFLAMLIGRFAGSRLSRKLAGLAVLLAALCIALVGFPLLWLAPVTTVRISGLFVVGLGLANVYPLGVALALGAAPEQVDRASARLALAAGASALVAPFTLGTLADRLGIGQAFGIVLAVLLAALGAALAASRVPAGAPA